MLVGALGVPVCSAHDEPRSIESGRWPEVSKDGPSRRRSDIRALRAERHQLVTDFLAAATRELLAEERGNPLGGGAGHPTVGDCARVILEEKDWAHLRYVRRDLVSGDDRKAPVRRTVEKRHIPMTLARRCSSYDDRSRVRITHRCLSRAHRHQLSGRPSVLPEVSAFKVEVRVF